MTTTSELTIDELVAATPATRDRSVDFFRAVSIGVVVCWHWVLSVTHWNAHGALSMPNPIGGVPLLWLLTWVLQIMPLFFFVGGFANCVSWNAHRRKGGSGRAFVSSRLSRLFRPIAVFLGVWTAVEVVAHIARPGYPGVLHWGFVVFVPLWFLGVYSAVVALVPITMRLHERAPARTLVALVALVAVIDVLRFTLAIEWIGFANVLAVFAFVHQLGYWFGDGTLTRCARRVHVAMVLGAVGALFALTTFGPYAHSMVAVDGERLSNMMPPNACIALLGVLQGGLALLARPLLNRWLARRRPWKVVVAVNGVSMTIFAWHMTAFVIAMGVARVFGVGLLAHPTTTWWLERPLWFALPGAFLALLVALFARIEQRGRCTQRSTPHPKIPPTDGSSSGAMRP